MRSTRKARKRLRTKNTHQPARCIIAALMSIGGGQGIIPSIALAETVINDDSHQSTSVFGNNSGDPAHNDTTASGNTISVTASGKAVSAIGGLYVSENDDVSGNTANTAGTLSEDAIGGDAKYGDAVNNTVNVTGGAVNNAYGGRSVDGLATENEVNISGGAVNVINGGQSTNSNAVDNVVNITGGAINIFAIGGQSSYGDANGNVVNMYGGTANTLFGGLSYHGNADGNTVNLYGADDITGGVGGGLAPDGDSTNNTVNILGTINISGSLLGNTIQTLNVFTKGNSVKDITGSTNIKNMNFYLPAGTVKDDIILTLKDAAGDTELRGTKYHVAARTGLNLNVGEKVTLLLNEKKNLLTDDNLNVTTSVTVPTGISTDAKYTFSVEKEGTNAIIATVRSKTTTGGGGGGGGEGGDGGAPEPDTLPPRTRSLVEPRIAMTSLLNGASDFVATQVMDEAEAVAIDPEISVVYGRLVPFAVFGGGSLKLDTGADTDLDAFYANLGLTKEIKNRNGSLYLGPIFEYGRGSYDNRLDDGIHGWGKGRYTGGGFFFRQRNHDGLYFEGDLRAGRLKTDYRGTLADGLDAHYNLSGSYIAAHLGLGKVFNLNEKDSLDTYIKYFYSRTSGDDVTIHSNLNEELYHFDSVDSHRLRIGARYYHQLNKRNKLYAGLAYQYEFSGKASATHDGMCTPAPSLKGSSGMAELGWQVKPDKKGNMTADLGVTAWAGKQKGVMGRLKLSWSF